jgi:hypothetical protein
MNKTKPMRLRIAEHLHPGLFSEDKMTAHRAASPWTVEAARRSALKIAEGLENLFNQDLAKEVFNAGYSYGLESEASPEEYDCAWDLYQKSGRSERGAL